MKTGPDHHPPIDEQLSAWLDDELPPEELELLRARLEASPERRARLALYSLIGSHLRDGQPGRLQTGLRALGLSARVGAALRGPVVSPTEASLRVVSLSPSRFLPYALAAGVALAAVGLTALLRQAGVGPGFSASDQAQASVQRVSPVERQATLPVATSGQASLSPQRLTTYLVYHGEYSGVMSARVTESHIVNQSRYVGALQAADLSASQ
jgi:negative regulator of sigma E activity